METSPTAEPAPPPWRGGPGWRHPDWSGRSDRWGRPDRWGRQRGPRVLMPALVALAQLFGSTAAGRSEQPVRALDALGYALLLVGPLALLVRHRLRPLVVVVTVAAAGAYFTLGYPRGPGFVAALIAVFGAVRTGHRVVSWVSAGSAYLVWALAGHVWPTATVARPGIGNVVLVGAWMLVAFAVADAVRVRSAHFAEAMRARAEEQRARAEQRRASAEQERRQVSEERLRIARELHDVLGHHLSLINVQAGVGLHLMAERPEQARASLSAIKQASAEALREVRAVLAALQADDESAPRTPAPTLSGGDPTDGAAGLRALVAEVRAAGLGADVEVSGAPRTLPAEVDRAAYRIVQEALTNVRRHAGTGARAIVRVAYGPEDLAVRVLDDGTNGSTVDGDGSGLTGMRERTVALGGDFSAGARAGTAGFEVYARLPAPAVPPTATEGVT